MNPYNNFERFRWHVFALCVALCVLAWALLRDGAR